MRYVLVFASVLASLSWTAGEGVVAGDTIPIPRPKPPKTALPEASKTDHPTLSGIRLTLADAVFMGLRENRTIKSAYIDRIAQKFDLRVAEDRFTPQAAVSGSISRQRIGGVNSTIVDVSPGVTMLTKTGATFDFAWNTSASIGGDGRSMTSVAEISVEQPLLRGAGVEINMAPVAQARLSEKINRLRLRATVAETIGNIIFTHRDLLLAQEELKLAESAVARGEDLLGINRALIASGRMAAMEAVQTEADIENQRLRVAACQHKRLCSQTSAFSARII